MIADTPRGLVPPGGDQGLADPGVGRLAQAHLGLAGSVTGSRAKGPGAGRDDLGLGLGGKPQGGPARLGVTQTGEDLAADSIVGVILLGMFHDPGQAQGQGTKFGFRY